MEDKTIRIEEVKDPEIKVPENTEAVAETAPEEEDNRKIVVQFKKVTKKYKLYKNDKDRFRGLFRKKVEYKEESS